MLVSGNSNSLFAIMNRLGVRSGAESGPCDQGAACVPCIDSSCFPAGFDHLRVLILGAAPASPPLIRPKY